MVQVFFCKKKYFVDAYVVKSTITSCWPNLFALSISFYVFDLFLFI